MIKVKISNFLKKNKNKIQDLSTKIIMVAIVVFIATIILSFNRNNKIYEEEKEKNLYKPTETIIKGSDVTEKQYAKDSSLVDMFFKYCNSKDVEKAYALISDDCKEEMYPTIEEFKNKYYNTIFSINRDYNIQSWISTKEYTVYRVKYTNDMISTGKYEKDNIYQDYVTLLKKENTETISIGSFILAKQIDVSTKTNEIEATVVKKKLYISDEEYEIKIKNKTDKTILLDDFNGSNIKILGDNGGTFSAYTNSLFVSDLTIDPGITKTIKIKFKKNLSLSAISEKIQFSKLIKDYDSYIQDKENYKESTSLVIKLED